MKQLTHKDLVKKAQAYLRDHYGCYVVITELKTRNTETPDAIGFSYNGASYLIECKVSRADFMADKDKIFRKYEEQGMGDFRYFMAPPGIINPERVARPWGLIEIPISGRAQMKIEANQANTNKTNEVIMLMSVIRRLEISTAVFVRQESDVVCNDSH